MPRLREVVLLGYIPWDNQLLEISFYKIISPLKMTGNVKGLIASPANQASIFNLNFLFSEIEAKFCFCICIGFMFCHICLHVESDIAKHACVITFPAQ